MQNPDLFNESYQATYCPEDNKLRLYVGRVPKEEYLALKAEGWTSTPKQSEAGQGEFSATWTPSRRDTCLSYAGIILDEDASPQDRAADRAERFGGYLDKRLAEATGHADRYDSGPQVHGFQSEARAERSAARHDRIATRACDSWEKAEYWQRRTAGVISSALYKSRPDVRMGRIKLIEAEIRKIEKTRSEYASRRALWLECAEITDTIKQNGMAYKLAYVTHGDYTHPRTGRVSYLYDHSQLEEGRNADPLTGAELCALWLAENGELAPEGDWLTHLRLRIAYENQMLEAQGGRAAHVEMVVGGFIGNRQIQKVNKSPATGRVVSVIVKDNHASSVNHWGNPFPDGVTKVLSHTIETERLPADAYRAPTEKELAAFTEGKKAAKAAAPKVETIPLINPTDKDAEKLQAIWNADKGNRFDTDVKTVARITQAQYSALSKGTYSSAEARFIAAGGKEPRSRYGQALEGSICKVRFHSYRVIILTDKPQKPLPAQVFVDPTPERLAIVQDQFSELLEINKLLQGSMSDTGKILTKEQEQLFTLARLVGYAYYDSLSQRGITPKGWEWARENAPHLVTA